MEKQVFTQELLRNIQEKNGIITLDLILEALPTWSEKDIKARLSGWRYRKAIDYKVEDGHFSKITLLRSKKEALEEVTAGKRLKMDLYFRQVLALTGIIESNTSKDNDKTKAVELQQKAMRAIPDDIYKELSEVYE